MLYIYFSILITIIAEGVWIILFVYEKFLCKGNSKLFTEGIF